MGINNFAGMSMTGGRRDNFFFCLIDYYADQDRWFLNSLLQVKNEEGRDGNEAIRKWINEYHVKQLVVDFPLSTPACQACVYDCPGMEKCPVPEVKSVHQEIHALLQEDQKIHENGPKTYERNRLKDLEYDHHKNILDKEAQDHILSRPFKRRLKKGFLPYWNRSLDFWLWSRYYDQMLDIFNTSYDSYGSTSLMVISRFSYLRRHFPPSVELFESYVPIILLEMLRANVIQKKDLMNLKNIIEGAEARLNIIKQIEKTLNIFIYEHDLEIIVKNPRAFHSFLLAVAGKNIQDGKTRQLPVWTLPNLTRFVSPIFS